MNDIASNDYDPRQDGRPLAADGPRDTAVDSGYYFEEDADQESKVNLRELWAAAYRHKWLILAIVTVCMLIGVAVTVMTTRIYRAVSTVQIEQRTPNILGTDELEAAIPGTDANRFLQTQVEIIRSRALAERVVDGLKLAARDTFIIRMGAKPPEPGPGRDLNMIRRNMAINLVRANLEVELPGNSRVAQIKFTSPDPAIAAQVANRYAADFVTDNLERKFETTAYARDFLSKQLGETKARLEDSERKLIAYARQANLIDTTGTSSGSGEGGATAAPGASLVTSDLVALNSAAAAARTARIQAEQRWAQAQQTALTSLPEVIDNPTVQTLTQSRVTVQAQYEEGLRRRQPDHPEMQQMAARISSLDRQINRAATSIRDSIRERYQVALRQEESLRGGVGALKTDTLDEQDRRVQYNILKRETDTNRTLYEGLLQRFKEVSAGSGLTSSNISIIDRATQPGVPFTPNVIQNLLIALALGIGLAVGTVFAIEMFDDRVRSPDDLRNKLKLPVLGMVPAFKRGEDRNQAFVDVRSEFAEAFYTLQTSLEYTTSHGAPRSILVTSTQPGEGKSTCAASIARAFASVGRRTLLIDGDLRRPSMHKLLELPNTTGLSNLLTQQNTLQQIARATEIPNLSFLSSGPIPPNPATLLGGRNLRNVIDDACEHFDIVVIDGPPVIGLADAPIFANAVEGTVFVVEAGRILVGSARNAIRRLQATGAQVLGGVLTKFDARRFGYSGYDYYYYYSNEKGERGGGTGRQPVFGDA